MRGSISSNSKRVGNSIPLGVAGVPGSKGDVTSPIGEAEIGMSMAGGGSGSCEVSSCGLEGSLFGRFRGGFLLALDLGLARDCFGDTELEFDAVLPAMAFRNP